MTKKNIYTAKDVAFDALFSSLSMLLLLTIYFLPFNKNLMGTLLLMFFSCAYKKKKDDFLSYNKPSYYLLVILVYGSTNSLVLCISKPCVWIGVQKADDFR